MAAADASVATVFLQPGGLFTGKAPTRVKTVLGSCVAITMREPNRGLAAMAHCLLPCAGVPAGELSRQEALRFVDTTIELMLKAFVRCGARPGNLEVKLFGGADGLSTRGSSMSVGARNVEVALAILASHGLSPAATVVGGRTGRVIEFDTASGEVRMRHLPSMPRGEEA